MKHIAFASLLDHLAGRSDARVAKHLTACRECARFAASAQGMLDAGRRAMAAPELTRKRRKHALNIFRDHHRAPRSLLALVLDSMLRPAAALRTTATRPRFLRYEGKCVVEIQITPAAQGVDLRGQVTPAEFSSEVTLRVGDREWTASLQPDGTFVMRRVRRGTATLEIGSADIADLKL